MIQEQEPPLDWTLVQLADEAEYWLDQILRTINDYERTARSRFGRRDARWWEEETYEVVKTAWRKLRSVPAELRELGGDDFVEGRVLGRRLDHVFTEMLNFVHLFEVRGHGRWFWQDSVRDSWEMLFIGEFREFWRLFAGVSDQLRSLSGPSQADQDYGMLDLEYLDLFDFEFEIDFTNLVGDTDWLPHIAQLEVDRRTVCVTVSQWPNENYVLCRAWKPLHVDLGTTDHEEAMELATRLLLLRRLFPDSTEWWRSLSAAALRYFPDPSPQPRVRIVG